MLTSFPQFERLLLHTASSNQSLGIAGLSLSLAISSFATVVVTREFLQSFKDDRPSSCALHSFRWRLAPVCCDANVIVAREQRVLLHVEVNAHLLPRLHPPGGVHDHQAVLPVRLRIARPGPEGNLLATLLLRGLAWGSEVDFEPRRHRVERGVPHGDCPGAAAKLRDVRDGHSHAVDVQHRHRRPFFLLCFGRRRGGGGGRALVLPLLAFFFFFFFTFFFFFSRPHSGKQVSRPEWHVARDHRRPEGRLGRVLPEAGHADAVGLGAPEPNPLVPQGLALGQPDQQPRVRGEYHAALAEPPVPRDDDRVEHRLEQQHRPHPLADDDVDLFGQPNVLHLRVKDGDPVPEHVLADDLPREVGQRTGLDGIDALRAFPGREHRENACASSDVHNDLALDLVPEEMESFPVRLGPRLVLEHQEMDRQALPVLLEVAVVLIICNVSRAGMGRLLVRLRAILLPLCGIGGGEEGEVVPGNAPDAVVRKLPCLLVRQARHEGSIESRGGGRLLR
mmetsp:Transcript_29322/g.71465  ORF Transcript_29322/g.71465 Transcript_29322/m.71465 type:complete len:507 (-) Transcript_29322:28-1548(-)